MRPVYMVSGGITKFRKASPDKDFRYMVKEAFDYAPNDVPDHGVLWNIIGIIKNDRQFLTLQVGHLA